MLGQTEERPAFFIIESEQFAVRVIPLFAGEQISRPTLSTEQVAIRMLGNIPPTLGGRSSSTGRLASSTVAISIIEFIPGHDSIFK